MASRTKVVQVSFNGGEVSEFMHGRIDDQKYGSGLAVCRNFICRPQGPVENRAGFAYVSETKDSTKRSRLIPFTFNNSQTVIIELGDKYARFHSMGLTVLGDDGLPLEISTPWSEADLFDLHYVQSADVMTITHPDYPPTELRRYGATDWRTKTVNVGYKIAKPASATAVRETAAADDQNSEKYKFKYAVSALNEDKTWESEPTYTGEVTANLYAYGTTVKISCSAVAGASFYRFYKCVGGLYGYIGDSETAEIIDDDIAADTGITPRRFSEPFKNGYPAAVGYYEQRRVFAGLKNDPQRIVMTRSATEDDFTYSLPVRDDDRISQQIATTQFNEIRHVIPLAQLILLTSGSEVRVSPLNSDAITPTSFSARPQGDGGASKVQPVLVKNAVVYEAARGGHVCALGYQYESGGYISVDLCLRSAHLFDFRTIRDMAYAKAPYPIVWCVSSSGELLGLTYIASENVASWHRHTTDGVFESCACVPEGDEDVLYCVIRREINGQTVRFVERMATRAVSRVEDGFFVDCGGTYSGEPTKTISGLSWLEGKEVSILADGSVLPRQTVKDGRISLGHPASLVHVGLPIDAEIRTLPITMSNQAGFGSGTMKNIVRVYAKLNASRGLFVGSGDGDYVEWKQRKRETPGSPIELATQDVSISPHPRIQTSGTIAVRQDYPLPIAILSLAADVEVSG